MSKEYIERDCLIDMIDERNRNTCNGKMSCIQMKRMVETIPAADAAPVRHGKWEYEPPTINTYGMLKCSKCGWWTLDQSACDVYHYCPNCGCKMDLEEQEITNADMIRAMSDEELAANLMCPNEMGIADIPCDKSDQCDCYKCLLDWLRKPAGEE